jgi:MYXO-CTERM domain-containing protein
MRRIQEDHMVGLTSFAALVKRIAKLARGAAVGTAVALAMAGGASQAQASAITLGNASGAVGSEVALRVSGTNDKFRGGDFSVLFNSAALEFQRLDGLTSGFSFVPNVTSGQVVLTTLADGAPGLDYFDIVFKVLSGALPFTDVTIPDAPGIAYLAFENPLGPLEDEVLVDFPRLTARVTATPGSTQVPIGNTALLAALGLAGLAATRRALLLAPVV